MDTSKGMLGERSWIETNKESLNSIAKILWQYQRNDGFLTRSNLCSKSLTNPDSNNHSYENCHPYGGGCLACAPVIPRRGTGVVMGLPNPTLPYNLDSHDEGIDCWWFSFAWFNIHPRHHQPPSYGQSIWGWVYWFKIKSIPKCFALPHKPPCPCSWE